MSRLLKAEMYKLKKTTAFKVLIILSIFFALMSIGITKLISSEDFLRNSLGNTMTEQQKDEYIERIEQMSNPSDEVVVSGNIGFHISSSNIFNPKGKELFYGTFGSGVIEIYIAVLVAALVASEYSKNTIKNTLAYGKKRYVYYINKIIITSIAAFICVIVMTGIAGIIGSAIWGWGGLFTFKEFLDIIKQYIAVFLIIASLSSLMTLIATATRSNGATMAIGIVLFAIVLHLIGGFYGIFDWFDAVFKCTPAYLWDSVLRINMKSIDFIRAILSSITIIATAGTAGAYVLEKQDIK